MKFFFIISIFFVTACAHNLFNERGPANETTSTEEILDAEAKQEQTEQVELVPKTLSIEEAEKLGLVQGWTPKEEGLRRTYFKLVSNKKVNPIELHNCFKFYEKNAKGKKIRSDYIAMVDFSKSSSEKRFKLINLKTGEIEHEMQLPNSVGSGSTKAGAAKKCGMGRGQTPCGFLKFGKAYTWGRYGVATRMYGLQRKVNGRTYNRSLIALGAPDATTNKGKSFRKKFSRVAKKGVKSKAFKEFVANLEKDKVNMGTTAKPNMKDYKRGLKGRVSFGGPTFDLADWVKVFPKLENGGMLCNYFGEDHLGPKKYHTIKQPTAKKK